MPRTEPEIITTDAALEQLCAELAEADLIAIDTEFVAEHSYRPQLCLLQVAVGGRMLLVDGMEVSSFQPFWEVLAEGDHETVLHAGRQEVVFCLEAVGKPPAGLWDVQLAAAMVGMDYPAGYNTLIRELLGETPQKTETRSDWRRRPLSRRQIDYALADVDHLEDLQRVLRERLEQLERLDWFAAEMQAWLADLNRSLNHEPWRRVGGSTNLSRRELAIVRQLWQWREELAERRNCVPRRVLRDDLIVELAKRKSADQKVIGSVRGLDRGDLKNSLPRIAKAIGAALEMEGDELPNSVRREAKPQMTIVAQFLTSALTSICRDAQVAPSIVGTVSDIRDLIAYRLDNKRNGTPEPALIQGWRSEVVGKKLDDLLTGRLTIRISDPLSDQPLEFRPSDE